jgi:uncharacterized protein YcfJ
MLKIATTSLLSIILLSGCANQAGGITKQQGGTFLGGATGALIGSQFGSGSGRLVGAGIGGVIGALAGSEVGKSMDQKDYKEPRYREKHYEDRDYYEDRAVERRDSRPYYYYAD